MTLKALRAAAASSRPNPVLTAAQMDTHNTFVQPDALVQAPYTAGSEASPLTLDVPPKAMVVVTLPAVR